MRRYWLAGCFAMLMSFGSAQQGELADPAVVDERMCLAALPTKRLAPNAPMRIIDLPTTVTPPPDWEGYRHPFFVAGYVAPAPPDLVRDIRWTRYEDSAGNHGQVGVLVLRSQGAKALRVRFSGGRWEPEVQLRVFDPVGGYAFPVGLPIWDKNGDWWTTIIFGNQIGLEFFVPESVQKPFIPPITAIAYHFAGPEIVPSDFDPASGCPLNDVSCYPDLRNSAALAVCMLAFISGGSVSGFCSGAAIGRNPADTGTPAPIVMTARHCVGTQTDSNATVFVWDYFTPSCNGTPPNPNTLPRSNGSLLLKQHQGSDWSLLGLINRWRRRSIWAGIPLMLPTTRR